MQANIKKAVQRELKTAQSKFPKFASAHEGYSVLLEEVEELKDALAAMNFNFSVLWNRVKSNDFQKQKVEIMLMKSAISDVLTEAVQVAAVIERFDIDVLSDKVAWCNISIEEEIAQTEN